MEGLVLVCPKFLRPSKTFNYLIYYNWLEYDWVNMIVFFNTLLIKIFKILEFSRGYFFLNIKQILVFHSLKILSRLI